MDIPKLREETPLCQNVIHFNNAGASPMPQPVYERLVTYLQREKEIGGYEAQAEHQPEIEDAYRRLADLFGARPSELVQDQPKGGESTRTTRHLPSSESGHYTAPAQQRLRTVCCRLSKSKGPAGLERPQAMDRA